MKFFDPDVSGITTLRFFLNFPLPPPSPSPGEGSGVLLAVLLGEEEAEEGLEEWEVSEGDVEEEDGAWWLERAGLPMRGWGWPMWAVGNIMNGNGGCGGNRSEGI